MAKGPTPEELAAMIRNARQKEAEQNLIVAAPMNDVQLMCLMGSYLLGSPTNYYRDLPKDVLAEEIFEITANITARSADPNLIGLRARVMEIVNSRQQEAGNTEAPLGPGEEKTRSGLVLVKD
jgi:hypothetical protein